MLRARTMAFEDTMAASLRAGLLAQLSAQCHAKLVAASLGVASRAFEGTCMGACVAVLYVCLFVCHCIVLRCIALMIVTFIEIDKDVAVEIHCCAEPSNFSLINFLVFHASGPAEAIEAMPNPSARRSPVQAPEDIWISRSWLSSSRAMAPHECALMSFFALTILNVFLVRAVAFVRRKWGACANRALLFACACLDPTQGNGANQSLWMWCWLVSVVWVVFACATSICLPPGVWTPCETFVPLIDALFRKKWQAIWAASAFGCQQEHYIEYRACIDETFFLYISVLVGVIRPQILEETIFVQVRWATG